jgi:hypothetical protein
MPNMTVVLRARCTYVELSKSGQVWGSNFSGRCRGALIGAEDVFSGSCATVTLHEWPQPAHREKAPAWISEESLGALSLIKFDRKTGEHYLQASFRVPTDVYWKALETDFSKDYVLVWMEYDEITESISDVAGSITKARLVFHTRNDPEHGLFGPIESEQSRSAKAS